MSDIHTKLMMATRHRKPRRKRKLRDGELSAYFGKIPDEDADLVFSRGDGVPKCDGHLLYGVFSQPIFTGKSLIEELIDRGYDLHTLSFSIFKRATPSPDGLAKPERAGKEKQ